jgi:hypothetical protein
MIGCRAILICDNARVEDDGTLTLAKVYNDRLIAPPGEGPIAIAGFVVVAIVRGLTGIDRIGIRHRIRGREQEMTRPLIAYHPHAPREDEHNFIFAHADFVFGAPGAYELEIEISARDQQIAELFAFTVERRS